MFTARSKIKKGKDAQVTSLEDNVCQALYDLQQNNDKLKGSLKEAQITAAKEIDLAGDKKAIIVFVPVPQLALFQKLIRDGLVSELEKKFSGKHVAIIAQRRIISKESRKIGARAHKQLRPRNRTLTAVHEKILDDLVFPNEILGKRLRYKADGSRLIKVHLQLDKSVVDRTDAFSQIYKRLTTKDVTFEFPATLA